MKKKFLELPDVNNPETKYVVFDLYRGTLTDNGATPWFTFLDLGTPERQRLKFAIDTGTTHTWVTSSRCITEACLMHKRYNPNESITYKQVEDPYTPTIIDFGPWGEMQAFLGSDSLFLKCGNGSGSIKEFEQPLMFYLSQSYDGDQFKDLVWDGGISLPSKKPDNVDSDQLMTILKDAGVIDSEVVTFYCETETRQGKCLMGAIDPTKFDNSSFHFIPLAPLLNPSYCDLWTVKLEKLECGFKTVLNDVHFCLDTGSSRFKGDAGYIEKIIYAVTNNFALPSVIQSTEPDFTPYPEIYLQLNGKRYRMNPSQYFMETSPGTWELAFHPMEGLEGLLLVGSVFLENLYSIFFYEPYDEVRGIGLAELIK